MNFISLGLLCPYCLNGLEEEYNYCCGEAGHGTEYFINCDVYGNENDMADPILPGDLPENYKVIQRSVKCLKK